MYSYFQLPRLLKGGLAILNPDTAAVQRLIVLQYNPDTLSRTLQAQAVGAEGQDRANALRLAGPPVETIKLEAEIDGTDQLEFPGQHRTAVQYGVAPQLAVLETLLYPASTQLQNRDEQAAVGVLEIVPLPAPLTLFIWSRQRIVPVRLSEFSVTEEAFDPALNPIRAKVSLGLRVLSITDLGFTTRGGHLFMAYLQQKERLAAMTAAGTLADLGLGVLP